MSLKPVTLSSPEFLKGISPLQISPNIVGGFFATATSIDTYRYPGMISPGPKGVAYTGATITDQPYTVQYIDDTNFFNGYLMTATKLHQIKSGTTIVNTAPFPHTFSGVSVSYPHSILLLDAGHILYFTDSDIGSFDRTTFTDNWGSTVPASAGALSTGAAHRAVMFTAVCYFTNYDYVGTYDPTIGANGTLNRTKFKLPTSYIAKDIRVINGNLEIYADNGASTIIITWDGKSILPQDINALDDAQILTGQIIEGFPHVITSGRGAGPVIRKKNYFGYPQVQTLNNPTLSAPGINPSTVTGANGQFYIGDTTKKIVWTYGTPFGDYSYRGNQASGTFAEGLNCPISTAGTTLDCLTSYKGGLTIASHTGGTFYLEQFQIANYTAFDNTNANFITNYTPVPDDSVIEKLVFYVLPVSANAAFTPQLLTNLGTVAWTGDDLTSTNLDANGRSKTYYVGGQIADSFAIGGSWSNSTGTNSVIITRIDAILAPKPT